VDLAEIAAAEEVADVAEAKKSNGNNDNTVRVTWVRSGIGYAQDQRRTIRTMGFTRLNQTIERPDTPEFRGQINKVKHLLRIEE
jgi:large subunit ribosomal protein L30